MKTIDELTRALVEQCVDDIAAHFEVTTGPPMGDRWHDVNQVRGVTMGSFRKVAEERILKLLADETETRHSLAHPLIMRGDLPSVDARIPLRIVQSIPVAGIEREVFIHSVAELNDHVSEDSPWYGGAVDFFLGGGGELRLYPPLSDGDD